MEILISAYLDGETIDEETHTLEQHLRECSHCQSILAEFKDTQELYHNMAELEVPRGFRQRVTQHIDHAPQRTFRWRLPQFNARTTPSLRENAEITYTTFLRFNNLFFRNNHTGTKSTKKKEMFSWCPFFYFAARFLRTAFRRPKARGIISSIFCTNWKVRSFLAFSGTSSRSFSFFLGKMTV
ncbi:hypothetical protein CSA56_10520 [candidate division KSB3 bacterium]|uniref:Putative zinc-finger domain-containing protein n=1 Tax=candidate division KSB3 bacterium TaxID=2044937 RepID=A0A2G6KEE5_9BACT|nr:MAG: hypothetical protein CSA56_10520 [candidate division KSB3 bacterium]